MLSTEYDFLTMINSPVRQFKGRVGLYEGSTLLRTFNHNDALQSFTVNRESTQGKFFGYGICQKLTVNLIDTKREITIAKGNILKPEYGAESAYLAPYAGFYVTEVQRDENTNGLTVTSYDALYDASQHTVSELNSTNSYTLREFIGYCANFLGTTLATINIDDTCLSTYYETGANFEGTETIREALNAAAEATQSIYYIDNMGVLTFKRLSIDGAQLLTIDKSKYFELTAKTVSTITGISHVTELGDNYSAGSATDGEMVYIRDNPFWELRDDISTLVTNALAAVNGFSMAQFDCKWRGNFLMEIGDKISLVTKDDATISSYLLDDSITYNGALSETSSWSYENSETEAQPSTVGDIIRQTYAKVNRAERTVDIVASEVSQYESRISQLELDTDTITASVEQTNTDTATRFDATEESLNSLTERLDAAITKDALEVRVQEIVDNGANHVVTETGFTFNDEGLTISKSDNEMKTTITEDGMTVYKNDEAVLTANSSGVDAVNLHASTYLIIGTNSRFEDYGADSKRTGCFWIG